MKIPKGNSGDGFVVPEGLHLGWLIHFIDMGTHTNTFDPTKKRHLVRLGFELPEIKHDFGREKGEEPAYVVTEETLSSDEKSNLRKIIQGWVGVDISKDENFDSMKLFDVPCQITITHNKKADKTYANIASIGAVHKSVVVPDRTNIVRSLSLSPAEFSVEVYRNMPEFIQKKIAESPEYGDLVRLGKI